MTVYQFSALSDGQVIEFDPTEDVLNFDQSAIAAADLRFTEIPFDAIRVEVIAGPFAPKAVTLAPDAFSIAQFTPSNLTFADGSAVLVGDLSPGENQAGDNGPNNLVGTSGRDLLIGLGGNDTMLAGAGDDVFVMSSSGASGGATSYGADSIDGGLGFDVLDFSREARSAVTANISAGTSAGVTGGGTDGAGSATVANIEGVIGGDFNDRLVGGGANNRLEGGAGNDTLDGSSGNDTLRGGLGTDTVRGGAGNDQFIFAEAPGAANADRVSDFVSGTDKLVFDRAALSELGAANFTAGDDRFVFGAGLTAGQDAEDRLVYNTTTGEIFYDADGSGSGASELVAVLAGAPSLSASDITLVGDNAPRIVGTADGDTLVGTDASELIEGRGGSDLIDGRGGDDTLDGGFQSVDTLTFQSAQSGVVVDLRAGTATGASSGNDTVREFEAVIGSAFDDRITTHDDPARFSVLSGAQGGDTLIGGAGSDTLSGDGAGRMGEKGNGNDDIRGGDGDDVIQFDFGLDAGSYGNDTVDGGAGRDAIVFPTTITPVSIDLTNGLVSGGGVNGSGTATLVSIEEAFLTNTATSDLIVGNASANRLNGGDGYDTIRGGGGDDQITMRAVSHTAEAPAHAELFGEGGDDAVTREAGTGNVLISGGAGNDLLLGGFEFQSFDRFRFAEAPGSANADLIHSFEGGSAGIDKIELDAAAFPTIGAAGNFAPGDPRFAAGAGLTSGRDADDRVIYNTSTGELFYDADGSGAGAAQLIATLLNFSGPAAFVPAMAATNIVVVGQAQPNPNQGTAGPDSLTGTAGDDLLEGLAGNDTLTGLAGNDTLDAGTGGDRLIGGLGNDTFIIDGPGDTVIENAREGTDTILSSATRTIDANVENLTLTGTAAINGTGNALNNVITGNSANNALNGAAGNDVILLLSGSLATYGADAIDGGTGFDVLDFGGVARSGVSANISAGTSAGVTGGGTGGAGSATVLNLEGVIGGDFNDRLVGGGANNRLEGGAGNDTLDGSSGNDTLRGGLGADTVRGGAGNDQFVFADTPSAANADRVSDFLSGTDELMFENGVFTAIGAAGAWAAGDGRFRAGAGITTGQNASDRLVYNTSTGSLFYDADGSGANGSVLVATFAGNPALSAADITVI